MKQYVSLVALSLLSLQAAALELAKHPQVFDAGQGVSLALAPSADTKALKPKVLLAIYQKQEIDGEASKACAIPLSAQVDWSAMSDEQLIGLSVPSFCGEVVNQMTYLCGKDDRYKAEAKTLKGIDCRFGESMKLREQDGQLQFTTHKDEPNQGDFINAILRNR